MEKKTVIGVRFKKVGKIYYFDPSGVDITAGTKVIVETARGLEFGTVEIGNRDVPISEIHPPLKKVTRIATQQDILQEDFNKQKEQEAYGIFNDKVKEHGLVMKLIEVELTFDLNKIIFYFTADGRVDFRELVKELASIFRMRIELRQIGVRDEAKILNSMGLCGRSLCCATFLEDFQPVSIKMAKEQGMSLNPTKISGICGRLMCCLKYEEETYEVLNKNLPGEGDLIRTPDGDGEVLSVSVLRQTVKAAVRKREQDPLNVMSYPVEDIKLLVRRPQTEHNDTGSSTNNG